MKQIRFTLAMAVALGLSVTLFAQSATPVADAARRGDAATVRTLLKSGADVNAAHPDGMTPLHWAAERGDAAVATALIPAGANLTSVTRLGGYTPLHLAARSGSGPIVRALLKAGASAAAPTTSGASPIHLASASGNVDAINALLDAGADVNVKENENQQTPLIFAVSQGHVDAIKVLLKRGANVNATTKAINLSQQSAEIRQATTIRRQVLAAIVPQGSQPTATQDQTAVAAAREFYATGKAPTPPNAGGAAGGAGGRGGGGGGRAGAGGAAGAATLPDAAAAAGGDAGAVAGGRAGAGGGAGRGGAGAGATGQQTATDVQNAEGPNVSGSAKGGLTALHHAARDGFTDAIPVLLDAGADINKKSADGNSPLLVALINGQFDVAMLLVEKGANANFVGEGYGVTPLWAAVNARWQPRTRFPQPQEMDYQKATYLDVMKALLEAGADPDVRVKAHPWFMLYSGCGSGNCGLAVVTGSTPFWRAAYGTDVDAMKLLVQYGADPNIPTMAAGGGGRGGGGGGRAGGGGAAGGRGAGAGPAGAAGAAGAPAAAPAAPPPPPTPTLDPSGLPPVPAGGPGVPPLHAAAGAEYGEGFAGNAHRHAPEAWLASVKYLVEVLGMDVNSRDDGGYTPLHHAAARGDNEVILYLVSKGADVKAVSRRNQTTVDMANGPVSRISPYPKTIELLMSLGAKNSNKCASCTP